MVRSTANQDHLTARLGRGGAKTTHVNAHAETHHDSVAAASTLHATTPHTPAARWHTCIALRGTHTTPCLPLGQLSWTHAMPWSRLYLHRCAPATSHPPTAAHGGWDHSIRMVPSRTCWAVPVPGRPDINLIIQEITAATCAHTRHAPTVHTHAARLFVPGYLLRPHTPHHINRQEDDTEHAPTTHGPWAAAQVTSTPAVPWVAVHCL